MLLTGVDSTAALQWHVLLQLLLLGLPVWRERRQGQRHRMLCQLLHLLPVSHQCMTTVFAQTPRAPPRGPQSVMHGM
jgi:hypothetical protein